MFFLPDKQYRRQESKTFLFLAKVTLQLDTLYPRRSHQIGVQFHELLIKFSHLIQILSICRILIFAKDQFKVVYFSDFRIHASSSEKKVDDAMQSRESSYFYRKWEEKNWNSSDCETSPISLGSAAFRGVTYYIIPQLHCALLTQVYFAEIVHIKKGKKKTIPFTWNSRIYNQLLPPTCTPQ